MKKRGFGAVCFDEVAAPVERAARLALALASRELQIPTPEVIFFERVPEGQGFTSHFADGVCGSYLSRGNVVLMRKTMQPAPAVFVAAHEARHGMHHALGLLTIYDKAPAVFEQDANAYAAEFYRRFGRAILFKADATRPGSIGTSSVAQRYHEGLKATRNGMRTLWRCTLKRHRHKLRNEARTTMKAPTIDATDRIPTLTRRDLQQLIRDVAQRRRDRLAEAQREMQTWDLIADEMEAL